MREKWILYTTLLKFRLHEEDQALNQKIKIAVVEVV